VHIKTFVLIWIVLPVLLLFISISSTEASNSNPIQENAGVGLEQKKLIDSDIQTLGNIKTNSEITSEQKMLIDSNIYTLKNTETDLDHEFDSENSANSLDNTGTNLNLKNEANNGAEKSESGSSDLVAKTSGNSNKESSKSEGINQEINSEADINADSPKSTVSTSDQETAIPVLNKNTYNRRLKILIVRNHFITLLNLQNTNHKACF
jgi:hypothetical protein